MSAADKLATIETRAQAAPPGDWYVSPGGIVWVDHSDGDRDSMSGLTGPFPIWADGAAEFIAHARTDVPALVAALRAVITLANNAENGWTRIPPRDIHTAIEEHLA